ncbi:hypothetical protein C9439_05335 [archaeon SCG-AAA382B04]|nr:hypothetical protein C9439_05335 [archaeon SCG-AAA382B04]
MEGMAYISAGLMVLLLGTVYSLERGLRTPPMDVKVIIMLAPVLTSIFVFVGIARFKKRRA